jgi:putative glutamine amidotransferase
MAKKTGRPLKIGLSANVYQPDFSRMAYKGRRLLYLEESMAHWVMASGALAFLLPSTPKQGAKPKDLVRELDGLIITGGVDMSPLSYGEKPIRPDWVGDKWRDDYEIALVKAALALEKPVLGICRGHQVLNVALGGSLYQDVYTQHPGALHHRIFDVYEQNYHQVKLEKGGKLARMFGKTTGVINSVHHQAVKRLAKDLTIEARSPQDDVVEALTMKDPKAPFYLGVQWHPEFQSPAEKTLLSPKPILEAFLAAAALRA